MSNELLISIIIPTIHRREQVEALLRSIERSTYEHFEILLIDQNGTDLLDDVVAQSSLKARIRHLRIPSRGTSHAKNVGAQHAAGEVLCFPDDDAELFPETLSTAMRVMRDSEANTVFGKCVDRENRDSVTKFSPREGYLSLQTHTGMFIEATVFVRRKTFLCFKFDETFGAGTFYGAEEAYDLVIRMLKAGERLFYSPEIRFYHPSKVLKHTGSQEILRVFSYRCGFSHLCIKHRLYGKLLDRLTKVTLFLLFLSVFNRKKVRYYSAEWLGLMTGICVR